MKYANEYKKYFGHHELPTQKAKAEYLGAYSANAHHLKTRTQTVMRSANRYNQLRRAFVKLTVLGKVTVVRWNVLEASGAL